MAEGKSDFERGDRMLTLLFIGPPLIWFAHLSVAYTLTPTACASGSRAMLHAATALALVLLATSGALSWRRFRSAAGTDEGPTAGARRRFMAMVGSAFAVAFTIAVLANEIPIAFLKDCA